MERSRVVLLDAKYDNLFKEIITAGWCVKSEGHVEAPQGYFSLTEIPEHQGELVEMFDAVESQSLVDLDEWPDAGWYVTQEDSNGMIRVYGYPSKDAAEKFYGEVEAEFLKWDVE